MLIRGASVFENRRFFGLLSAARETAGIGHAAKVGIASRRAEEYNRSEQEHRCEHFPHHDPFLLWKDLVDAIRLSGRPVVVTSWQICSESGTTKKC
jgi:hypothetical protein